MDNLDSAFKAIGEINELVGNSKRAISMKLKNQALILRSEVDELIEAIDLGEDLAIRDAQADIAFVLAGFEYMYQPMLKDLEKVIESNLTKFDYSLEDALKTKEKYEKEGLTTRYEIRFVPLELKEKLNNASEVYVTYVHGYQTYRNQHVPDGKWLKSVNFKEPSFE